MIIINENLADILEDGNARRGWWLDLKRRDDECAIRLMEYVNNYIRPWKEHNLIAA